MNELFEKEMDEYSSQKNGKSINEKMKEIIGVDLNDTSEMIRDVTNIGGDDSDVVNSATNEHLKK